MSEQKNFEGNILQSLPDCIPSIYISKTPSSHKVNFWVSFFKSGPLDTKELLNAQSLSELFSIVDDSGLVKNEPLLISRQDIANPFLAMFLATPSSYANQDINEYCLQARTQILGLGQTRLGLHIPAGFLPPLKTLLFVSEIIQKLYVNRHVNEVHLSLSGYPLHERLNLTWRIQNHLRKIGQPILLFH